MKPSFAIVGSGKVGTSLGWFLSRRGYPLVGIAGRNRETAEAAARLVGTDVFTDRAWEITPRAEVVFITTPDGAISGTCEELLKNDGFKENAVVLHCSGSLPSTILSFGEKGRYHTGSLHPLQSFAAFKTDWNPFRGIIAAVEGDAEAIAVAREMANDLGATPLEIRTEAKSLYHAAAVVASNYLVSLMDLSLRLMADAGISGKNAIDVLYPLVRGTLSNIEEVGIPEALTGPIARGDVETVTDHLTKMATATPDLIPIYKSLGRHTIKLALDKKTVSQSAAKKLREILKE
jgi:predicted short-subunit dehydrogenase-like oxidoreductase (DUF2520 family)